MKQSRLFSIITFLILLTMRLHGQETPLSLEELIPGGKGYYKYRVNTPYQLGWMKDDYLYVKGDTVYSVALNKKEKNDIFVTLSDINNAIEEINLGRKKINQLNNIRIKNKDTENLLVYSSDAIYEYDCNTKKITGTYPNNNLFQNQDFSTNNQKLLAYTNKNNLHVVNNGNETFDLIAEPKSNLVYGQSVHRNEFGINKGTFWSPNGNLLAYYKMDESMVTDYPLVDVSTRVAELKNIKYPMAGMKSHEVQVGIFDTNNPENIIYLKTGTPKEKYLTNIAWSPNEKSIYIAEVNRGQDTCKLNRYNVKSGKLEATLFTETHPKYVEPENPPLFLKNDSTKFLWQSKRDGYNHIYLYNTKGELLKQITSGKWDVTSIVGFDEKGDNLIYISCEESPIERHVYKINIKNGNKIKLSKEEGVHSASISSSGKYIYDYYTSQHNPGKIVFTNLKTNENKLFFEGKNPYKNIELPEIEIGSIKANDGQTDLYYRLIKPLNFDPQKKYPTIVYVYGGPHSQLVNNSWMGQARGWDIYMAEKGYVVFTIDNRGTSYRGLDFENITHRQLGIIETEDQMTGIDFLKRLSYVDENIIGVHGWSYGGFMTLNLMLRHPETFKVGVAGGPVTDWKYYEIMYGERYMDSPKENPAGYKNTSMVERAGDLKGRLLIIHGDEDPIVVPQHSLQFLKSAVNKGTHPDFFIYPGHEHNVLGHNRVHLHEHITRYFEDHLK